MYASVIQPIFGDQNNELGNYKKNEWGKKTAISLKELKKQKKIDPTALKNDNFGRSTMTKQSMILNNGL